MSTPTGYNDGDWVEVAGRTFTVCRAADGHLYLAGDPADVAAAFGLSGTPYYSDRPLRDGRAKKLARPSATRYRQAALLEGA